MNTRYGAGPEKLGSIVGKGKAAGAALRKSFLAKTPALKALIDAVQESAKRGYLTGLDGRLIPVRSPHAALNTLLQSAGAILSKQWIVLFDAAIQERGWGDQVKQLAWVHDEIQVECPTELAEAVGALAVECIVEAGKVFNFRVHITGEYKIGRNWLETH